MRHEFLCPEISSKIFFSNNNFQWNICFSCHIGNRKGVARATDSETRRSKDPRGTRGATQLCNLDKRQRRLFYIFTHTIYTFLSVPDCVCVDIFCKEFILRTMAVTAEERLSQWRMNKKTGNLFLYIYLTMTPDSESGRGCLGDRLTGLGSLLDPVFVFFRMSGWQRKKGPANGAEKCAGFVVVIFFILFPKVTSSLSDIKMIHSGLGLTRWSLYYKEMEHI